MKETKDFEQKLKRLEEIVTFLEREERPLEETMTLFKEGMKLTGECRKTLSEVELSISKAAGAGADGSPILEDFIINDDK